MDNCSAHDTNDLNALSSWLLELVCRAAREDDHDFTPQVRMHFI